MNDNPERKDKKNESSLCGGLVGFKMTSHSKTTIFAQTTQKQNS
jgi:hypothetical protein